MPDEFLISCRNLWKIYGPDPAGTLAAHEGDPPARALAESGHVAAVRDVSLDIPEGELLVVMGLSGSGKSTLVRCLSRLVEATSGEIMIEGQDLRELGESGLLELRRRKMGMVFQNFALLPHRTVLENVAFPLEMRGQRRRERRERAAEVIRLVGLEGREEHFPRELSGGQQQRVGIARSLAIEPDIWFLDEPFSALDPLIRREMQDEFLRLRALLKKTIVFITHDFDEALRLADRIAIMYEGRVEQIDTPDRIVMAPATDYVARFTSEISPARVVHAHALAEPINGQALTGQPVPRRCDRRGHRPRTGRARRRIRARGRSRWPPDRRHEPGAGARSAVCGDRPVSVIEAPTQLGRPRPTITAAHIASALFAAAILLTVFRDAIPAGLMRPPEWLLLPISEGMNRFLTYLQEDLGLATVTRGIADGVGWLLDVSNNLLTGKRGGFDLPAIPWSVIAISGFCLGWHLGGWRLALLTGGTFVYLAVFGQWRWAMQTLSQVAVAVPLSVGFGFLFGVLAWRNRSFEAGLMPVLNVAQSMPHLSYLIPIVIFFGVGDHAGVIATVVFATPPMIRMTILGLRQVPPEVIEAGKMCGATGWQVMRHARVPTARAEILVGVNQVIMQCLAMVVIASFIGSPGLGDKLLNYLQALRIGRAIEIGVSIVLIAVMLDRLSRAWAERQRVHWEPGTPWIVRHRMLVIWLALMGYVAAATLHPLLGDWATEIRRRDAITTRHFWDAGVDAITTHLAEPALQLRTFLSLEILIPVRDAFQSLPFTAVLLGVGAAGLAVGGVRTALICVGLMLFPALSGWWDRTMITVYMVSVAVAMAVLLGLPLGIWAAQPPGLRGSVSWWVALTIRLSLILLVAGIAAAAVAFVMAAYELPSTAVWAGFGVSLAVIFGLIERFSRDVRRDRFVLFLCDSFQTFPSFIYLIPVIMLFQVNDVAAIGAVIIYATVPMTRYTIEGLREVPPVDAGGGRYGRREPAPEAVECQAAHGAPDDHGRRQPDGDVRADDGDHRGLHRNTGSRPADHAGEGTERYRDVHHPRPLRRCHRADGGSGALPLVRQSPEQARPRLVAAEGPEPRPDPAPVRATSTGHARPSPGAGV